MKTFNKIYIYIFIIFHISCIGNRQKSDITNNVKYEVDIDGLENQGMAKISSYFKSVKPIFLETSENCLIKYIDAIQVTDNYIFILDRNSHSLYSFDEEGKFRRKIGKVGPGPGEFSDISDFSIDNQNQIIYMLDIDNSTVNSYKFTGEFIITISLPEKIKWKSGHIQFVNGKIFLDYGFLGPPSEKDNPLLIEIDMKSGKMQKEYLSSNENNAGFQLITFRDGSYFYSKNSDFPCYAPIYSGIIYSLKDKVEPFFQLKSDRMLKREDIQELDLSKPRVIADINRIAKIRSIRNFFNVGEYLICEYLDGYGIRSVVYSKSTKEANLYEFFFDDLFYSTFNHSIPHYFGCSDNQGMYAYLNINDVPLFVDYYKNGFFKFKFDNEQLEIINSLSEESNPLLFYYELR